MDLADGTIGKTAPLSAVLIGYVDGSGNLAAATAASPLATSGKVVGDDGAVIAGSKSDTVWDGSAGSPTWTALWKYIATKLEAIRVLAASTAPVQFFRSDSFLNITTNATTVAKSGAGTFTHINFNKPVATGTVAIYDNTAASGTLIGTFTIPASPQPSGVDFGVAFATGLTIVTAVAAQDITVVYR